MTMPAVLAERTLTFTEAVQHCPFVHGKKPTAQKIYFWCDRGLLVRKSRVRLECARIGGRRLTSVEAIERFVAAVKTCEEQPIETPAQRRKAENEAIKRRQDEWLQNYREQLKQRKKEKRKK